LPATAFGQARRRAERLRSFAFTSSHQILGRLRRPSDSEAICLVGATSDEAATSIARRN
jgi:hypothetical protein